MRKEILSKTLLILLSAVVIFQSSTIIVRAVQGGDGTGGSSTGIRLDTPGLNLDDITLPTFVDLEFVKNFSAMSYITLGANLVFLGIVLVWIVIIIRAAVNVIKAYADEEPLKDAQKKIGNVFASIAILIGFIVVVTLVAGFFGLGSFWDWPKSFSKCTNGKYFYTVLLETGDVATAEDICF